MLHSRYITPVMFTDGTGYAPKTWNWIASITAVAIGLILVSTGIFSTVGGALIGAGINSMVSGYISEATGGSFQTRYIRGSMQGGLCAGLLAFSGEAIYDSLSYGIYVANNALSRHLDTLRRLNAYDFN